MKLNYDGSVVGNLLASYGGLLTNAAEEFVQGFAANVGCYPVIVAELWGAFNALSMAWSLGSTKILLELDSSCAVTLIQNPLD